MRDTQTWQTITASAEATEQLGVSIGARLRGGEVIELLSDLGGGKTTFVRGLARGAGSSDRVASPTFTISREYKAGKLTISHFDFYRLTEAGVVADELAELIHDPNVVTIVEWGAIVADVLPKHRLTIRLEVTADDERQIRLTYPGSLAYLIPEDK